VLAAQLMLTALVKAVSPADVADMTAMSFSDVLAWPAPLLLSPTKAAGSQANDSRDGAPLCLP